MTVVATYPEKMGNIVKFEDDRSRGLSRKVTRVTCIANGAAAVNLARQGQIIGTSGAPLRAEACTAATDIAGILVYLDTPFEEAGYKDNCVLITRDSVLAGPLYLTNASYVGAVAKADGSGDTTATLTRLAGIATGTDTDNDGETTSNTDISTALTAINAFLKTYNIRVDSQV